MMSTDQRPKCAPCQITPSTIAAILEVEFVTVEQAAAAHYYAPRTIRMWCDEGRFEAYKWGGRWMIVKAELAKYCRKRRD